MFLNKDVESWAKVQSDSVMAASTTSAKNVLTMALADIQRLGEELADTKADADAMAARIQAGDRSRDDVIEECAKVADRYPGVYGNSPTAAEIRKLKTKPLS